MFEERRSANTRTHSAPCKNTFYFTDYHNTHSSRSRRRRVQVKKNKFKDSVGTVKSIFHDSYTYGVATVSRIDQIIGLFCKRAL